MKVLEHRIYGEAPYRFPSYLACREQKNMSANDLPLVQ